MKQSNRETVQGNLIKRIKPADAWASSKMCWMVLAALCLLFTAGEAKAKYFWNIIEVDDWPGTSIAMTDRSLCLGGSGNPKLVFGGGLDTFPIYNLGGQVWLVDLVTLISAKIGQYASLPKTCSNNVAFYEENGGDLMYSYKSGSLWNFEYVDQTGTVGLLGINLAFLNLPSPGYTMPSILYYDWTNKKLKHAYRISAGNWTKSVLDDAGPSLSYSTEYTSLGSGQTLAHASYYKGTGFDSSLHYAWLIQTNDSAWAWDSVEVDSSGAGYDNSIAVDVSGFSHISYRKWTLRQHYFKYARGKERNWITEVVETCADCGRYTSIALDNLGNPAISYYDALKGDLKFAYKRGGTWHNETVDAGGDLDDDVGEFTSLAIDAAGRPHISYYNRTKGKVKYAVGILSKDIYLPLVLKY